MKIKSNPSLTILTIVFGLLILNVFFEDKTIMYVSTILSGLGILSFKTSIIIEKIWFKLSFVLSLIIPNVLLTIIYFFFLTPIALLSKIFNNNTNFNSKNTFNSTFVNQSKSFDRKSFERTW